MDGLLGLKEKLINLYAKHDIYINFLVKFIFVASLMFVINGALGCEGIVGNPGVILILALLCMFLPKTAITYIVALYTVASVYTVSLEYAAILLFVLLLVILLYMQFAPEYAYIILVVAAACVLKLPLMAIILTALFIGPAVIVPTLCGTGIYYIVSYIPTYLEEVSSGNLETGIERIQYIVANGVLNKELLLMLASILIVSIVVYFVKRMDINYSWRIAISIGTILHLLIIVIGGIVVKAPINYIIVLLSTVISVIVSAFVSFFARNLDYNRVERVQFEDEEYYYYVKAIPKKVSASIEKASKID